MFTVALIGPDGAGKTTICRQLQQMLPMPAKYVYMGINLDTSSLLLPTTRLLLQFRRAVGQRPDMAGPRDPTRVKRRPRGVVRRALAAVKAGLKLANQLGEEWFRASVVWYHQRRGYIVLFDRHFFSDYYASDVANTDQRRPLSSRIHGFFLNRFYPRPNLVINLDAPAEVLLARKGEGTIELLERRRQEFNELRGVVPDFVTIDATRPTDQVAREVSERICEFYHESIKTLNTGKASAT